MSRLFLAVSAAAALLVAAIPDADACGCRPPRMWVDGQCLPLPPPPPLTTCDIKVAGSIVEGCGVVEIPADLTVTNVSFPDDSEYEISFFTQCVPQILPTPLDPKRARCSFLQTEEPRTALLSDLTAPMPVFASATAPSPVAEAHSHFGICTATVDPDLPDSVALDPSNATNPDLPSTFTGSTTISFDCGGQTAACFVAAQILQAGKPVCSEFVLDCILAADCGAVESAPFPTVTPDLPVVCADNGETVPVGFTVALNGFDRSLLPLTAVVTPSPPRGQDPSELFDLDPDTIELDFSGGTSDEQSFTIGCGVHGPCFQGVGNDLSVTLFDKNGDLVEALTGFQSTRVTVCDTPLIGKELVGVEYDDCPNLAEESDTLQLGHDATLHFRMTARNPAENDDLLDVVVTDLFPRALDIVDVRVALSDYKFDEVEIPFEDREVAADVDIVRTRDGQRLEISNFDIEPRDLTDARVLTDTVEIDVTARLRGGRGLPEEACGEAVLNLGPELVGSHGGELVEELAETLRVPVSPRAPGSVLSACVPLPPAAPTSACSPDSRFVRPTFELSGPATGFRSR